MGAPAAALQAALAEPLAALGVDVEAVDIQKAGRRHVVRIVVDRDGGVDLDLVATVSRQASELLDSAPLSEVVPGPFVLEVTSPGVDRPLTELRHWRRARTRLVQATLADGTQVDGRITDVGPDDTVVVTTDHGDVTLRPTDVRRAVVQVEFNRADIDGADTDDATDDADDAVDEPTVGQE